MLFQSPARESQRIRDAFIYPPPLPIRKNLNVFAPRPRKSLQTQHLQTFWSIPVSACGHRTYCAIFLLTSDAVLDYDLYMITDRAVLLAVRRAPCGHTSVESFIAAHGVTRVRPSLRGINQSVRVRIAKRARSRTGSIVRAALRPSTMSSSSVVSLGAAERPYNGSAMKVFGPRG